MKRAGSPILTVASACLALGPGIGLLSRAALGQTDVTTAPAAGQTSATQPATAPAAPEPYWLRVTPEEVNIRSRPDANSEAVARVPRDTVLRAVGEQFGWHRILPPEGVFSYVSAALIERRGEDEGVVAVQSGTLRVRVGSLVRELDPTQSEVQALLPRGASVRIVGTQGDWLKIVPPESVYVHVSAAHVIRVSDEVAERLRLTASQPAVVAAAQAAATATRTAATRRGDEPDLTGAWGRKLVAVEADIQTEARKPLLDRAWGELIPRLRPIADQRAEPAVAHLAAAWIAELEQRSAEQQAVRAAEQTLQRIARERAQHERELALIERSRQAASRPAFDARGALRRSEAAGGRTDRPRYLLQDPLSGRVEVYVEFDPDAKIDLAELLGKYVGVRGERRPAPALGADVLRAKEIVVLDRETPDTRPAPQPP
jgi:hypothetical protein